MTTSTFFKEIQAFVEMGNIAEAVAAKKALHNQNIYTGCCTLIIRFGTTDTITIKHASDKAVDYTKPSFLPFFLSFIFLSFVL
jgi:hypothetical protein